MAARRGAWRWRVARGAVAIAMGVTIGTAQAQDTPPSGTIVVGPGAGKPGGGATRSVLTPAGRFTSPSRRVTFGRSRATVQTGRIQSNLGRTGIGSSQRLGLGVRRTTQRVRTGRTQNPLPSGRTTGITQGFIFTSPKRIDAIATSGRAKSVAATAVPGPGPGPAVPTAGAPSVSPGGGTVPEGASVVRVSAGTRAAPPGWSGRARRKTSIEHFLSQGRQALTEGKTFEAGGHFLNAILDRAGDPIARLAFAQAKVARREYAAASRSVRAAVRLSGGLGIRRWHHDAGVQPARALADQTTLLRQHLSHKPDDPDRLLLVGVWYLLGGEQQGAVGHVRRALELRPNDAVLKSLAVGLTRTDQANGLTPR